MNRIWLANKYTFNCFFNTQKPDIFKHQLEHQARDTERNHFFALTDGSSLRSTLRLARNEKYQIPNETESALKRKTLKCVPVCIFCIITVKYTEIKLLVKLKYQISISVRI